jgi:hypothetical protein
MLQPGIGAQALARPTERTTPILPTPIAEQVQIHVVPREPAAATGEPASVPRQFVLTPSSDRVLKKIVAVYSDATRLDLKHSEFLRAMLVAVEHALPELAREAAQIGQLKRPKNDRGNEAVRDQMERRIAEAFVAGMRAVGGLG